MKSLWRTASAEFASDRGDYRGEISPSSLARQRGQHSFAQRVSLWFPTSPRIGCEERRTEGWDELEEEEGRQGRRRNIGTEWGWRDRERMRGNDHGREDRMGEAGEGRGS